MPPRGEKTEREKAKAKSSEFVTVLLLKSPVCCTSMIKTVSIVGTDGGMETVTVRTARRSGLRKRSAGGIRQRAFTEYGGAERKLGNAAVKRV